MITYILGLIAGVATPLQASVNGSLRTRIRSPYIVSSVSFSVALLILVGIVFFVEGNYYIPIGKIAEEPLWIWFGGLCGVVIVLSNVICLPKLGSAMNIILLSFGQIMTGIVIDNWGLFGSVAIPMTLTRVIGAALLIAGVVLTAKGPDKDEASDKRRLPIAYVLFAIIGGMACALQVAINGRLTTVVESSWRATLVSMIIGTAGCLLFVAVLFLVKGSGVYDVPEGPDKSVPYKWYMFLGGLCAVVIVGSNSITAPILGTGIVTVLNLIGQTSTSLLIDASGFLGIDKQPITRAKVVGMIFMIIGTAIIMLL